MRVLLACVLGLGLIGAPASADPAMGVWQTPPDKKGQTAHIDVHDCWGKLCGRVSRAFDPSGREITTPNVGKLVFWDMTSDKPGTYQGQAWVPAHNRQYKAAMKLAGSRLKVSGCLGPVCQGQTWTRIK
jgi:uncharacterized protein (DUF2147 family)